jgi:hypothetical protein
MGGLTFWGEGGAEKRRRVFAQAEKLYQPAATALHESIVEAGAAVTEAVWDALLDRSSPDDSATAAMSR